MNEEGKVQFSSQYFANAGKILNCLHLQWEVDDNFKGDYTRDYKVLQNNVVDDFRMAWINKYTTSLYELNQGINCRRYELQPIPHYLRWYRTTELQYLPVEERAMLSGTWDDIPAMFLPSKVLDLCAAIMDITSDDMIHQVSLLSWIKPGEVKQYYRNAEAALNSQIECEREKERWKGHPLYRTHTKAQLESQCRGLQIPVTAALHKHELVSLITEKKGEALPPTAQPLYLGILSFYSKKYHWNTSVHYSKVEEHIGISHSTVILCI